ncbi:MAG: DUF349 domain-containing protein [Marinilabiliales bacterium]|nr:MAG: DUF349 domain-containing protein [Marinilabiliales bacterium]
MQPDQNPDLKVQEEKPETVKKTVKKETEKKINKPKKQLTKKEREGIVSMLKNEAVPVPSVKKAKPKQSKKTTSQIKKPEKVEIVDLLKDKKVTEPASEDESSKGPIKQISKKEKEEIRMLLSGGFTEKKPSSEELVQDEIDYDQLNKQELVELLEDVVEEKDVSKIKSQVAKIKTAFYHQNKDDIESERQAFIADGGDAEKFEHVSDPLEQRFDAAFSKYRHHKSKFAEELEKEKQLNLQLKIKVLENLKELINSEETLKKTYDEFKNLQDEWKQIGMVPATELSNLWQNYHFLVEKFFDKVRINNELRDLDLKKNLELKIELCEKAEELLMEKSIIKSFKLLQKYHDEWREIGPAPSDKKEELWDRFKAATDKINQRRKDHYKDVQEDQQKNYEAKLQLIGQVEEILANPNDSLKDWQKNTQKINNLFKLWKSTGRAPRAKNDEVWEKFKGLMDSFFESKRAFFNELKDEQTNNYNLKLDLCINAEALKDSEDWKNTTNELIKLQKEWKKIGPVPRRNSDKIWKRFRSACDHFFNRKSEYYKNIHVVEDENLKKKKEIIKAIRAYKVANNKEKDLKAIKEFQRQWLEIGFVPFKEKDTIQDEYRDVIDKLISTMDINKIELTKADFKNKIEMLKAAPDSGRRINQELFNVENKIKKIKEDVALWENNIGFFSSSKQSELLKKEFQVKIDKAKKEINTLKAKLKMLREAE